MNNPEQQILKALDEKLWKSADKAPGTIQMVTWQPEVA